MALTAQASDWITRVLAIKERALTLQEEIQEEVALYNLKGFNALQTADIQEDFPHLDNTLVLAQVTGLTAIDTAMGDMSSGHASNFIKSRG